MSHMFTDQELKQFSGPTNISKEEMRQLAMLVANAIVEGDDLDEIVADLTNSGWELDDAQGLVGSIQHHMFETAQPQSSGSGVPGWIVWISFLIGFNVLSHFLGWGIQIF